MATSKKPSTKPADDDPVDEPQDNVRPIDDAMVDFDVDTRTKETYPPYRIKMDGQMWTVHPPDAGTVMAAEQSPTTEQFMSLMFDEQWDDLAPIFKEYPDPGLIFDVASRIGRHFDLDAAAAQGKAAQQNGNRAERRRSRPRRR